MKNCNNSSSANYTKIMVYWDEVEKTGVEEYDESFLASLRNEIKAMEQSEKRVLIVPKRFSGKETFWGYADSEEMNEESETNFFESFTSTMLHVARRIKDCKNVIGFAYPDFNNDWDILAHHSDEYKDNFIAAFQKKHSHYIFVE